LRALHISLLQVVETMNSPSRNKTRFPRGNFHRFSLHGERHHAFHSVDGFLVMLVRMWQGIFAPTGTVNSNIAIEPFVSAASSKNLTSICPTRTISFFISLPFIGVVARRGSTLTLMTRSEPGGLRGRLESYLLSHNIAQKRGERVARLKIEFRRRIPAAHLRQL
jgi:hypothetical protein